jgi:hypothetical protein
LKIANKAPELGTRLMSAGEKGDFNSVGSGAVNI